MKEPGPRLLANGRLWYVLVAFTASSCADGFLPVAESFAVLQVTGSAGKLGIVLAVQGAASLVLSLVGGVTGDRFPRNKILITSSLIRMTAAVITAAALLTHTASFGLLFAAALVYGCADGFFGPVSSALLPDLVPRPQLAAAISLIGAISSTTRILALAAAGITVAALGPGAGFACEAGVLALAAGCLSAARIPAHRQPMVGETVLGQLEIGWREFRRVRWLWLLTIQWTLFSLLVLAPMAVLGPAIANRFLGGAAAWGTISSCLALGAVFGQLGAGRISPTRPILTAACLVPLMIAEALALGLAAPTAVAGAAAVVTGLAMGAYSVIFQTAIQATVPAAVLARVSAFDLLGSEVGQPIGYALAGPIAAAVGLHRSLAAGAAIAFIAVAALALPPSLRMPFPARRGKS